MQTKLKAMPIEAHTKGEIKRLRREGFVPVSIQHRGDKTRHFQEESAPLDAFIRKHGESGLLSLEIGPGNIMETVIVHDVQRDPMTHKLLHVTFQSVLTNEPMRVHVPLVLHGQPEPVQMGEAFVQQPLEAVEIRCLPGNLPDHLTVDISHMVVGSVLRVADLPASKAYEVLTSADTVLVSLTVVRTYVPEENAATANASEAQPEGANE